MRKDHQQHDIRTYTHIAHISKQHVSDLLTLNCTTSLHVIHQGIKIPKLFLCKSNKEGNTKRKNNVQENKVRLRVQ